MNINKILGPSNQNSQSFIAKDTCVAGNIFGITDRTECGKKIDMKNQADKYHS
jgi:hypothetical protein